MNLITVSGYLGAGKTLGMSYLAHYWANQSNATLFSNYALRGSKQFVHLTDFLQVANEQSSIVCLDESHLDLSSRDFNTNSVKWFTNVSFYLRKMRCTLMLTTPLFSNLDTRIRGIVNIHIQVSKDKQFFYYDFYDMQRMVYLKRKRVRYADLIALGSSLYDTFAMVVPLEYPAKKEDFNKFLHDLKATNERFNFSKIS